MSRILGDSGFYDEGLIDHRNTRPLAVAFAAILLVWTVAFGLVSASGQLKAQTGNLFDGCAAAMSTMAR